MPAFAWNIPAATDQVVGANIADDQLAAINTIVTANSGGANAKWEVAAYQAISPRYVVLRRKSGAAGRIIFFGQQGSTPNAAAVYTSATASALYCGYSKTSTANTPDASWLTAAPLSASDYMPGMRVGGSAATWRCNYAEFADGFYFLFSNSANGMFVAGAGEIVSDTAGAAVSGILASGVNGSTSWATTAAASSGSIVPAAVGTDGSYTSSSDAGLLVRTGGANRQAFRAVLLGTAVAAKLNDGTNGIATFFPIPLVYNSSVATLTTLGKLRQVAFGPNCDRETVRTDGTIKAFGHQASVSGAANPGFWFPDIEV